METHLKKQISKDLKCPSPVHTKQQFHAKKNIYVHHLCICVLHKFISEPANDLHCAYMTKYHKCVHKKIIISGYEKQKTTKIDYRSICVYSHESNAFSFFVVIDIIVRKENLLFRMIFKNIFFFAYILYKDRTFYWGFNWMLRNFVSCFTTVSFKFHSQFPTIDLNCAKISIIFAYLQRFDIISASVSKKNFRITCK